MPAIPAVLRDRGAEPGVTNMELFFDLVYVFAITQLSHSLLEHLTWRGALETLVLFGAVWWAWNLTAWATNWIDPDRLPVRVLLLVLMVLSLVMSAAIPEAFGERATAFAIAYVALQLLRSAFVVAATRGSIDARNFSQLLAWSALAGVFWVAGAAAEGDTRLYLWIAAVLVDWGGPLAGFWLPGRGSTPMVDWKLLPSHLAERCQLVVIIALGESVLVTGQSFSELERTTPTVVAFVVAFAGSAALWWLYFARHADAALERIARLADPTRSGRGGYAYAHALMVAGIVVVAVGDELVIAHPSGELATATAMAVIGGPALFALGMVVFLRATGGMDGFEVRMTLGYFALLALLAVAATAIAPLTLSIGVLLALSMLVAAAAWHARDELGSDVGSDAEDPSPVAGAR